MNPEILEAEEQFEFQKAGGGTGVVLRLLGSAFKWLGIGFFFHSPNQSVQRGDYQGRS